MSQTPEPDKKPKYNNNDPFIWVDSQWEKFMKQQKEDKARILKLENENTKLRVALCNLRDEYLDLGGEPDQLELFDKNDVSQLKIFDD